jgi:hypothetical protein
MRTIAIVLLILFNTTAVHAQSPGSDDEEPPPPPRPAATMREPAPIVDEPLLPPATAESETTQERYGLQILAIDAVTIVFGMMTRSPGVLLAGYTLGAPAVHVAHGNAGGAFASLALHGGALGLGTVLASGCDSHYCGGPVIVGFGVAALLVTTIDAAFLARAERPSERRLRPAAGMTSTGLSLGIAGSF